MLAPEGYPTIFIVFLFSALTAWGISYLIEHWSVYLIYLALLSLCGLILFFFRDPERTPPGDDGLIIAPADGRVVQIKEVEELTFLNQKVTQISIFLSPLDVHVNRVPVTGRLEYLEYFPGKFLMAWEEHASEQNERAHFGVVHPTGRKFLFKQITGFMARRIVYHIREGDTIQAGQRFGIMKFGSRMDILIPLDVELKVKEGDRTVAGESILGVIQQ
ncbi:MAG: phosphatidylserine decarboxylase family protein [Balneolaceae bacterium]